MRSLQVQWSTGKMSETVAPLFSAEELMVKADSEYDELKKAGTWGKTSEKDEQIVALTAKIATLQKDVAAGPTQATSQRKSGEKYSWKYDSKLSNTKI